MKVNNIIAEITPFYNKYKLSKKKLSGTETLFIMWDIGDILLKYISYENIPPHNLFRQIYGKGEGKKNIAQKSYISREFQGRCYRIRNIFKNKEQIKEELPTLINFTTFREAMPFFDNEKYKYEGEEKKELLKLLNCKKNPKYILEKIKKIQKEKIKILNPRNQRLKDLEGEKNIFINTYNCLYNHIKLKKYFKTIEELNIKDKTDFINILSKNTSALSTEGLKKYDIILLDKLHPILNEYAKMIEYLLKKEDEKERRRFRRLITPERIIRLADMLFALTSEKYYNSFR